MTKCVFFLDFFFLAFLVPRKSFRLMAVSKDGIRVAKGVGIGRELGLDIGKLASTLILIFLSYSFYNELRL